MAWGVRAVAAYILADSGRWPGARAALSRHGKVARHGGGPGSDEAGPVVPPPRRCRCVALTPPLRQARPLAHPPARRPSSAPRPRAGCPPRCQTRPPRCPVCLRTRRPSALPGPQPRGAPRWPPRARGAPRLSPRAPARACEAMRACRAGDSWPRGRPEGPGRAGRGRGREPGGRGSTRASRTCSTACPRCATVRGREEVRWQGNAGRIAHGATGPPSVLPKASAPSDGVAAPARAAPRTPAPIDGAIGLVIAAYSPSHPRNDAQRTAPAATWTCSSRRSGPWTPRGRWRERGTF